MKYVALLSGGKDSCFNLVHCHKNGHELIAAASLGPGPGKEELDSFMYQTVGQDAIHLVARALDVPLYRRVITGNAVDQGIEYGSREKSLKDGVQGDETEDLYELLASVKAAHPDIQAVSVGAILSNYQRVRVEHVCSRLKLIPLAYLWQRDQAELLNEMIQIGMEVILIKVAGIGLLPQHLGKTLAEMQPHLMKLNSLYGSHVCGEGGEYETLTLDCPLFKQKIQLYDVETVVHSDNAFATVAYLRVKDAELQPKEIGSRQAVVIPPFLEDEFASIAEILQTDTTLSSSILSDTPPENKECVTIPTTSRSGSWVSVCNVQRGMLNPNVEISLEDEVVECFTILQDCLSEYNLKLSDCNNINILISSMDLFGNINAVYEKYFGTSPPSRACVAVDLPHPIRLRLDCTAFTEKDTRTTQALHVQGWSYWAPANIGPYSQATTGEIITVSGQIGLLPSNSTLPTPSSLSMEFALSCQHVSRIQRALRNGWEGLTLSAIYFLDNVRNLYLVRRGHELLQTPESPTMFVVVKALPKTALVEKQVIMHTGRREVQDEEGESMIKTEEAVLHKR
ncbi:hypothetical protein AGABI2DRAFT_67613 [Agaricus bisporus var. bisporus H97]|uniref:hypothetical protein n=1 Tax=Agaricus bisporus var. bisporus (strain H97 / ATCC MYA-4626 / FGSC 10389) TaxID=936046 RepID=UPI00029F53CE|nr:hypothetical protein AGABI2DRAFT_67613 [Agaricus bisporus var. bisporus H97]EKV48366.1 hypothetical protein AGABI2DRAFT_67613 [Agaricus bisporus var. bisporus H97]